MMLISICFMCSILKGKKIMGKIKTTHFLTVFLCDVLFLKKIKISTLPTTHYIENLAGK